MPERYQTNEAAAKERKSPDTSTAVESGYASPVASSSLIDAVEIELCRLHGFVGRDGFAKTDSRGRGRGVRTALKLALPKRTPAALGKVCLSAYALVWLGRRPNEVITCP